MAIYTAEEQAKITALQEEITPAHEWLLHNRNSNEVSSEQIKQAKERLIDKLQELNQLLNKH